jgi:predicted secreted protein/predicted small lipoprotein YifL
MSTKFASTLVAIILLVTLAGCGAKNLPTLSADKSQSDESETYTETNSGDNYQMLPLISGKAANIQLDSKADGTTQQLKVGEILAITLESNISTGYSWFITISEPKVLVQMGEPQYQESPLNIGTPMVGAAGKQTFILQATEKGTTTVTLEYKQGFETDISPEKTIIFTAEVK